MAGAAAGGGQTALVSVDVTAPAVRVLQQTRGHALRTELLAAGLTQKVGAELAGMERENLANIEAGCRPFSAETEARIREAIRQAADAGCKDRKPGRQT
jgi:hypothetical protein